MAQAKQHTPVGRELEGVLRKRRAQYVAAEVFEAVAVAGGDGDRGVEIKPLEMGVQRTVRTGSPSARIAAEALHRGAGKAADPSARS